MPFTGKRLPAVREPRRDDVVVFDSVEEEGLKVVKRLVGMPGDTLSMVDGVVHRNGEAVEEPWARHGNPGASADASYRAQMRGWQLKYYVGGRQRSYEPDLQNWGPIVVPEGHYLHDG